jgi:hypothetical protein
VTVGLLYYDLHNATAAQPGLTDAFIAHCHSATSDCTNPASWAAGGQTRLSRSGSFDYLTAPNAAGLFLGDYAGLTSSGTTFMALLHVPAHRHHRPVRHLLQQRPLALTALALPKGQGQGCASVEPGD